MGWVGLPLSLPLSDPREPIATSVLIPIMTPGLTLAPKYKQICNEEFPWCVNGGCSRLTGSPWHDVGMPPSELEWFVSWVPLVGGSIGAMVGGFLSDRLAQVRTGGDGGVGTVFITGTVSVCVTVAVAFAELFLFFVSVVFFMCISCTSIVSCLCFISCCCSPFLPPLIFRLPAHLGQALVGFLMFF